MWRGIACIVATILLTAAAAPAGAQQSPLDPQAVLEEQITALPTADLEAFLRGLDPEVQRHLPPFDLRRLVTDPDGTLGLNFAEAMRWLVQRLVHELALSTHLLLQLIVLAVVSALLKSLAESLGSKEVTQIASMVSVVALAVVGLQAFRTAVGVAGAAVDDMVGFMQAVLPLLTALLVAVGGVTSAAVFHPLLISAVIGVGTVVQGLLLPLAFASVVFALVGKLSEDAPITRLSGLIRHWSTTILSFLFVVFMGIVSIRGAIGPAVDGLGIKTAKFFTGAFIPVIGGRIADALDVVVSGSLLIKNAVGAFGMATVFVLAALPVMKIFAMLMIFRVAGVLVEPVSEERLVSAVAGLGDGVALVLACVLTVSVMFFLAVTVLVALGNVTAVMR